MIVPFPGTPPRTPRLDPAYWRAQRSVRRRMRWWAAKRWLAQRPWLVAVVWYWAVVIGGALLAAAGVW